MNNIKMSGLKISETAEELKNNCQIAVEIIKKAKRITITSHRNPDGDAIGSELGLYYYVKNYADEVRIINHSPVPYNYEFLVGSDDIYLYEAARDDEYILNSDLIIVADVNDTYRLQSVGEPVRNSKAVKLLIDHHLAPKDFANHCVVDCEASSTGEIVWKMIREDVGAIISPEAAAPLYAAIMTDTGSFRYPRTDAELHAIVSDLIACGADPVSIYDEIYNRMPVRAMRLLGEAYSGMELFHGGKLCIMILKNEHFDNAKAEFDDVEGFVETAMSMDGVKIAVLLTEKKNSDELRISFRSKADYEVRDVAVSLNGGGHKQASGARVSGIAIEEAKKIIAEKFASRLK
ncbi:MAG: bifunctional oligoribonuclease/PAP phosphatase NrnA [Chlorobi bacterium]|nr:bifunctional oligoribonuclease/PAP phosphatase NrnA [Chlorobiota bacterium]